MSSAPFQPRGAVSAHDRERRLSAASSASTSTAYSAAPGDVRTWARRRREEDALSEGDAEEGDGADEAAPRAEQGSAWDRIARWAEPTLEAAPISSLSHEGRSHPWRLEAALILRSTLPIWGTHLLEMSNNAAGIVSIGHLGTTELAAAALSNMTANVSGFAMLAGFVGALDTVLPPVYSSNPRTMGIWAQRMMLLIGVLLLPVLAVWLNTERLLLLLGQDAEVSALAGRYLQILSLGLPAYAGFEIARRYLQAEGFFFAPTLVLLVTTPLNIALQIILVPRIGFIGAPIAIVAFLWASLLLGALQICFFSRVEWSGWSAAAFRDLGPLARIGAASSISVGLEWWSWEIVALLTSRLGTFALAAQSILLTSSNISYQLAYALSTAAAVRIGNLLGASLPHDAKRAAETSLWLSVLAGLFNSLVFIALRDTWGSFFTSDERTVALVRDILPLLALFQVADAICGVAGGVLRGTGRQSASAALNMIAYYVIGIPIGLFLTFGPMQAGLHGLWTGLTIALAFGAAMSLALISRTNWDAEVDKAARLSGEQAPLLGPVGEAARTRTETGAA